MFGIITPAIKYANLPVSTMITDSCRCNISDN